MVATELNHSIPFRFWLQNSEGNTILKPSEHRKKLVDGEVRPEKMLNADNSNSLYGSTTFQDASVKHLRLLPPGRSPLCRFQWVNPNLDDGNLRFSMSGKITDAQSPFCTWINIAVTEFITVYFDDSLTADALFNYRQKRPIAEFCRITRLHIANS